MLAVNFIPKEMIKRVLRAKSKLNRKPKRLSVGKLKTKVKDSRTLHRKAWKLKSKLVRTPIQNGYVKCFTCGKILLSKEANAGHYIHKNALDFHPINIQVQCVGCNKWLSGNLGIFAHNLILKYGLEEYKKLEALRYREHIFSIKELEGIIEDLKQELLKIIKDNGH